MIPRSIDRDKLASLALQNGYDCDDLGFIDTLRRDHPVFCFKFGAKFAFRPARTIIIGPVEQHWRLLILHELSHAICKHRSFKMDVERLKMECEAWEKARELAVNYGVSIEEELIQTELDTYRDWLHQKSRCPKCGLTRFQTPDSIYHCPLCDQF